jgi:Zn-dependent M28 family amino/carboxypeptidase
MEGGRADEPLHADRSLTDKGRKGWWRHPKKDTNAMFIKDKEVQGGCMRITKLVLALVLALLVAFGVVGTAAMAIPTATDTTALRNAVTVDGIMKHENAFQNIADSNDDTRVSGTPGYDASAAYVKDQLKAAGYKVTVQEFTYPFFQELPPTTFSQTAPTPKSYSQGPDGKDFNLMGYSGSGDLVDVQVVPIDIKISDGAPPNTFPLNTSTSGCELADFPTASATEFQVALIQRGGCLFRPKVENAQAKGYDAAIIFNEGQEGRTDLIGGGLGGLGVDIPVLMTSFAVGQELYDASPGARVSISADTIAEERTTSNVIADYPGGDTHRTLMVGAHLDSVPEGPGINDNGSGVAGILEIALQMRKLHIKPTNHVRFAFWGAEESSPPQWGSQAYLEELSKAQRKDIARYLNFDMIGSPNFVRFVYDGDGPTLPLGRPAPEGSKEIEKVFLDYFASQKLATEPIPFDGRSDYQSFFDEGIPAGGAISGAEGIKTPEQAAIYGGTAGVPYDSCYHKACDTINNLNQTSIEQLADGAAHATLTLAQTP